MTGSRIRSRLHRLEKFIEPAAAEILPPPTDISETLAAIASIRELLVGLSVIDRKRWYCPDDPRSEITIEETEQEAQLKIAALEKMRLLGFPEGYGEHHYDADRKLLRRIEPSETNLRRTKLTISEEASRGIIQARIESLYEAGPRHRARQRVHEIQFSHGMLGQTLLEDHEMDHLNELHPCQEEITGVYGAPFEWMSMPDSGIKQRRKARLDEWHSRKGEDPRYFLTYPTFQQFPSNPHVLERQNQQLAEMGFAPLDSPRCTQTKEEWDAELRALEERCAASKENSFKPFWKPADIERAHRSRFQGHPPLRSIILPF